MTITTLASGSSGNSCLISHGSTHILVDAGISCARITKNLSGFGLEPQELTCVLITHEHSDHISGLEMLFKKFSLPVWCSTGTGIALEKAIPGLSGQLHIVRSGHPLSVGNIIIIPFATSHNANESMGFTFCTHSNKMAIVTDLGTVTPSVFQAVQGSQLLVVEANYDPEMLSSGPYPPALQKRIAGQFGHLSNADCAAMCAEVQPKTVLLAHISQKNNTPDLAVEAVQAAVGPRTLVEAVPRCEPGKRYHLS